jgi:hypothetical protein
MPSNSVPLKGEQGWNTLMKQRREFWAKDSNNKLSKNFRGHEFYCNDGSAAPTNARPAMVRLCAVFLEPMRAKFGMCYINSGYRHTLYNASIGGATNSQHIYDHTYENVAVDVRFAKGTPTAWAAEARRLRTSKNGGKGGVGRYIRQGFVHIDNRAYKADWNE